MAGIITTPASSGQRGVSPTQAPPVPSSTRGSSNQEAHATPERWLAAPLAGRFLQSDDKRPASGAANHQHTSRSGVWVEESTVLISITRGGRPIVSDILFGGRRTGRRCCCSRLSQE